MGAAVAAADVDGDGWIDLLFTGGVRDGRKPEKGPAAVLYRNRGDGTFEDVTARSGIQDTGWTMGAFFTDLDGDGDPDLFITASGGNRLYRNLGGGRFERVPDAAGLSGGGWSVGAAFLDADRDGRLDVYLGNYLDSSYAHEQSYSTFAIRTPADYDPLDNALYRQSAEGRFIDATAVSGTAQPGGKTIGVVGFDATGDGIDDLFVANDRTPNAFFRGRGDGTFEDATASSGIDEITGRIGARAGMGIAVGDVDGDGRPDAVVTNFGGEPVTLYRNAGEGLFEDATDAAGLTEATRPYVQWGVHLEDLDNDGALDLPIVSGHLVPRIFRMFASLLRRKGLGSYAMGDRRYRQPLELFRGRGDGTFEDVTERSGDLSRVRISGRGSACADFDGDGRLDLAVAAISGGVRLLRNVTARAGRHAIEILPVPGVAGLHEPATVIGTRIVVSVGERRDGREFIVPPSYGSGSWVPLHFGVGDVTSIDRIEVYAPGSREPAAAYTNVAVDRVYTLGADGLRPLRPFRSRP